MAREWAQIGNRINEVGIEGNIQTLGDLNVYRKEVENKF